MKPSPEIDRRPAGLGLRLRLWIGCLAGGLFATGALALLLSRERSALAGFPAEFVWVWLPGLLGGAVTLSVVLALWLDRGVVGHLAGLTRGLAHGDLNDLRGLPSSSGWGELSELTQHAQSLLARQRHGTRSAAELEDVSSRLLELRDALDRWSKGEAWESRPPASGALGPLLATLNRELARLDRQRLASLEVRAVLADDVTAGLGESRKVAEQAERGFVEATALLTTIRELERLGGELQSTLGAAHAGEQTTNRAAAEALDALRAAAADAIGALVGASTESVEHLAEGMLRVQEIADRTRVISNRATLIALNVLTAGTRAPGAAPATGVTEDLKTMAREVREASDAVASLSGQIEHEAAAARARMAEVRASVARSLDSALTHAERATVAEPLPDASRLIERVREMIRDATAKGERLSSSGERASRAAARLQRRVESEAETVEQLAQTLTTLPAELPVSASGTPLRVLDRSDMSSPAASVPPWRERRPERGESA